MNVYIMVGLGGTGVIPATAALKEKLAELKGEDKVIVKTYGKGLNWQPDRIGYPFRMFKETLNLILDNKPEVTDVIITGPGVVKNLQSMLDNMLDYNITMYYFKQKDMEAQLNAIKAVIENVTIYKMAEEAEKPALKEAFDAFAEDMNDRMLDYYSNVDEWVEYGGFDNDLNPIEGTSDFLIAKG